MKYNNMATFNRVEITFDCKSSETERAREFRNLIETINLRHEEDYDCSELDVWSYRKANDIREGVNIRFGNMCNGSPFTIAGIQFFNSECAYIAGAYAGNNSVQEAIQRQISAESNGMKCKRIYRRRIEFTSNIREDFYTYNIQWMIYILWNKCLQNNQFSDLLRAIPVDAHVVENTSFHKGESSTFWGAKNRDLTMARKIAEAEILQRDGYRFKKDREMAMMHAANAINNIGHFEGYNVIGKIIKVCSLSLIYGQEPPFDFELLNEKKLYLVGNLIKFPGIASDYRNSLFVLNARYPVH